MQDPIEEWLTAGGLTLTGAIASAVIWARKARIRLVSGKDIADMREEMRQEIHELRDMTEDIQVDVKSSAETQQGMREDLIRFGTRVEEHERRLNSGGL